MSIVAEYTRFAWESQGGWRGVEPYVDVVILRFGEDYDEREDEEPTRTEKPQEDGCVLVKLTQTLPYQRFEQQESGEWWLTEQGERTFTDSMIFQRSEGGK